MVVLRGVGLVALDVLRKVVIDPIRRGVIRAHHWPRGLGTLVVIAYSGAGIALLLVLLGGMLRDFIAPAPLPSWLAAVPLMLVVVTLTLLWAGALHASAWARWPVAIVIAMLTASLAAESARWSAETVTAIVLAAGLLAWTAARGGRGLRWWDAVFGAISIGFATTVGVLAADASAEGARVADFLAYAVTMLVVFALPTFLAAGLGVAEVAVTAAAYTLASVARRLGRAAVGIALALVLVWRGWDLVAYGGTFAARPGPAVWELLGTVLLVAAVGGLSWAIARLRRGTPTELPGLTTGLAVMALPLAAIAALPIVLMGLLLLIRTTTMQFGAGGEFIDVLTVGAVTVGGGAVMYAWLVVSGIGLVVLGLVVARRGVRRIPEALVVVGSAFVAVGLPAWLGASVGAIGQRLAAVVTVCACALLVWALVRRRLDTVRLTAIAALTLAAACYEHRELIADPIGLLLGSGLLGTIVFGQVWGLITGAEAANEDSARYPRSSRVLVTLGLALLGLVVLAHTSLDPASGGADVAGLSSVGVNVFGTAMFVGAVMILARAALRGERIEVTAASLGPR